MRLHPFKPLLAVACADGCVRLYDRRTLATRAASGAAPRSSVKGLVARFAPDSVLAASDHVPAAEARRLIGPAPQTPTRSQRITSLQFSSDGDQLLASYSADAVFLIDSERTRDLTAVRSSAQLSSAAARDRPRRVRLRGDWSDTGPNSKPAGSDARDEQTAEAPTGRDAAAPGRAPAGTEGGGEEEQQHDQLLSRLNSVFQRWLDRNLMPSSSPADATAAPPEAAANSRADVPHPQQLTDEPEPQTAAPPFPPSALPPLPDGVAGSVPITTDAKVEDSRTPVIRVDSPPAVLERQASDADASASRQVVADAAGTSSSASGSNESAAARDRACSPAGAARVADGRPEGDSGGSGSASDSDNDSSDDDSSPQPSNSTSRYCYCICIRIKDA